MKILIITGPSGSGKTDLANKLSLIFDDTIVIKTDSYYRDGFFFKLLSIFKLDIYDRIISIKTNEIKNTLNNIFNKSRSAKTYYYDFKKKKSVESKIILNYTGEDQFLILEGIFSHRLDLNYKDSINILCDERKQTCFQRRLKRDKKNRGRSSNEVNKKFAKSWTLFYENLNDYINNNNVTRINPQDNKSYNQLVFTLKNIKNKKTKKNI